MGGLLSGFVDTYNEEHEKRLAEYLTRRLDSQIATTPYGTFGSNAWQIEDLKFRKKLVQFALERRISLASPHWDYVARSVAAKEHPALNPKKRPRGNPGKPKGGGLLSALCTDAVAREVKLVESIKELEFETTGKKISTAKACRLAVELNLVKMITPRRLENIVSAKSHKQMTDISS